MSRHLHTFSIAAVTALALLAGAPEARAAQTNVLDLKVQPGSGFTYAERIVQPGYIEAGGSAIGTNGSAGHSGTVHGSVDWGVIKLTGEAFGVTTTAAGTFYDMLTLTSPQVANGTAGVLTYDIVVAGSLHAGGIGSSTWSLRSDYGDGGVLEINRRGSQSSSQFVGDPIGTYSGTTVVVFGDPTRMWVELFAGAVGTASSFDLGQSLYWGGVSNLRVNGIAITEFTLSSESGTDYTHSMVPVTAAVPEPASVVLLLAGLGLMLAWRRPGRSR